MRETSNPYMSILYSKYNKLALTKKELCKELGFSLRTLNTRISQNMDIPSYIKGKGTNSKVLFPIDAIADYLMIQRLINDGACHA